MEEREHQDSSQKFAKLFENVGWDRIRARIPAVPV
jgi:hypothetical protein